MHALASHHEIDRQTVRSALPAAGSPPAGPAPAAGSRRPDLSTVGRLVVKLGTRVLVDAEGRPRLDRLDALAAAIRGLRAAGREVVVVSSGAVGLGRGLLGCEAGAALDAQARRACAAVGQSRLQSLYQSALATHGLLAAQVLLTGQDFGRRRHPELRATLERLLDAGVVPVVNENDAVSLGVDGLRPVFRDNDGLAALVAARCGADLLVLLTDVDGVCDRDPRRFADARPLDVVDDPEALLAGLSASCSEVDPAVDSLSRGGMRSKVAAAVFAARGGCQTVIAHGAPAAHPSSDPSVDPAQHVIVRLLAGEPLGTYFPAELSPQNTKDSGNPRMESK